MDPSAPVAGAQFFEALEFAEANNITLGGGHSVLAPVLGVDGALQFKVVTPDGVYRTANVFQNEELLFALRGGGGSTFSVVLQTTVLAAPV
ncbi:hypothetical protein FB451DRAFT_1571614 [Mycena latifolia]|nr:hypothetical protein FB451DRAFT_1571614 [Mycena latifolia]